MKGLFARWFEIVCLGFAVLLFRMASASVDAQTLEVVGTTICDDAAAPGLWRVNRWRIGATRGTAAYNTLQGVECGSHVEMLAAPRVGQNAYVTPVELSVNGKSVLTASTGNFARWSDAMSFGTLGLIFLVATLLMLKNPTPAIQVIRKHAADAKNSGNSQ